MDKTELLSELFPLAVNILLQANANIADSDRKKIAEFHDEWREGCSYGSNYYLTWGVDETGRAILWRTTRNVSNAAVPPDLPQNPQSYVRV